eukprot:GHRR01000813.1.p1 GENE.GHRR01000813.1~~GHRR01000813.1.p1  ORF type:complete len:1479 (+),score=656.13 GHRR01000813.1:508-4437(+)
MPEQTEPKSDKPKREPKPKKPRADKPKSDNEGSGTKYIDDLDDEEFNAADLVMEDNVKDEDFQLDSDDDEAMEVRPRRSGGGRAAGSSSRQPQRNGSRRAAAAGVAAAVAAAAAAEGYAYDHPAAAAAATPTQPFQQQQQSYDNYNTLGNMGQATSSGGAVINNNSTGYYSASNSRRNKSSRGSRGRNKASTWSDDEEFAADEDIDDDDEFLMEEEYMGDINDNDDDDGSNKFVIGSYQNSDFSNMVLKRDHYNRPLWVCSDGRIFLETYSPIYKQAYDFLIAIAEPVCRPESIHEYVLTPQSLYAAVSVGLDKGTIISVLDKLSKVKLTLKLKKFIVSATKNYGKVKLVLKHNRFWLETAETEVLERLLANPTIHAARAFDTPGADARGLVRRAALKEHAAARLFKATLAAAQEGAAAAATNDLAAGAGDSELAVAANAVVNRAAAPGSSTAAAAAATVIDGIGTNCPQQQQAAQPPSPQAAAAAATGGRLRFNPFGDSESESDPEDFIGISRRQPASQAEAAAAAPSPPIETAVAAAAAANAAADAIISSANVTGGVAAGQPVTNGAAAARGGGAEQMDVGGANDGGGDSPVVGGRMRRKRAAAIESDDEDDAGAVGAPNQQPQGDMDIEEADIEELEAMAVDAEQQQQPQRRGRLAATAALAAVTEAIAGDRVGQGVEKGIGSSGGGAAAAERNDTGSAAGAAVDGAADGGYEEHQEEEDPEREIFAFEIQPQEVERVKQVCMPPGRDNRGGLDLPVLEEYDFSHDTTNPPLDIGLKPGVQLRPYQEKSLSKMFGNGRARSGIIVLPCGAGKSLVGVAAASRIKKSCLCLCTSSVSVDQWSHQFKQWTNLQDTDIVKFVAGTGSNDALAEQNKQCLTSPCVCVTTFNMIAHMGKRSAYGEAMMNLIRGQEWGLVLLDEVHVVPARMFRTVTGTVKAHCKLGLTATLVREDELIGDLNFLIGPKLYEANWLDLTRAGHIANVQCVEVWCPMTREFYAEYLNREASNDQIKQLLYVMNPNKFMVCQYLVRWHEQVRGDKVIVFSDNVYALEAYARALNRPFIYGKTSHQERTMVLSAFKNNPQLNCIFLSKVGDNSLDIPEANVLIQISSHAGSRRQEAQRLGRILRAKKGKPGSGEEDDFNAFFYTLVSRDTQEMYYSAKRQQFLVDQGYAFKVIPNLHQQAAAEDWVKYRTQDQQLELLGQVLHAKEVAESLARECGKDVQEAGDKEDLVAAQKGWNGRFGGKGRKLGPRSIGAVSGGAEYMYNEYTRAGQKGAAGGQVMLSGPQGLVAKQERAARTKKIRQKLAG